MRVLLCGYGSLAQAALEGLLLLQSRQPVTIVGVLDWEACQYAHYGAKRLPRPWGGLPASSLTAAARRHQIACLAPDCTGLHRGQHPLPLSLLANVDVLLVASWGERLQASVLEACCCLNVHPSLLPRHRGSNPIAATLLAGDAHAGVSLHRMSEVYDAGAVLHQHRLSVGGMETSASLQQRVHAAACGLVFEGLQARPWQDATLGEEQNAALATTHTRADVAPWIDARHCDAATLALRVRALNAWGCVWVEGLLPQALPVQSLTLVETKALPAVLLAAWQQTPPPSPYWERRPWWGRAGILWLRSPQSPSLWLRLELQANP